MRCRNIKAKIKGCHFDKQSYPSFPIKHYSSIFYFTYNLYFLYSLLMWMSFLVFESRNVLMFIFISRGCQVLKVLWRGVANIPNQVIKNKQIECWWTPIIKWKCLMQPEIKYINAYTQHPHPPQKKINRPGTATFGSEIPGSATGLDISATCYSHSGRS